MGYFTNEDFDLLAKWGGKKYDSTNNEHQEVHGKLESIKRKLNTLAEDVTRNAVDKDPSWNAVNKSTRDPNRNFIVHSAVNKFKRLETYYWVQYYPKNINTLGIFISINSDKEFIIQIFPKDEYISEEIREKLYKLMEGASPPLSYVSDYSGIINLDKDALISKTQEYFGKLLQEFNGVYQAVMGSEPTTPSPKSETKEESKLFPSKNIILYGPPGTGKTHKLIKKYFPEFTEKKKVTTKEDFIKLELAKRFYDPTWYEYIALAMLDLDSEQVTTQELKEHFIIALKVERGNNNNVKSTLRGILQRYASLKCKNVAFKDRSEPAIFLKNEDSTWKLDKELVKAELPDIYELWEKVNDFSLDETNEEYQEERYGFVTFHQSFSYEDFIEGIKPNLADGADESSGELAYIIEDGIFKRMAIKAASDPSHNYAIFIDEINRGNISNIFGELITLIEDDKRKDYKLSESEAKNTLSTILPYSKKDFWVPDNLYLIGTMNTADRSIEALDSALRRRFSFIEMAPDYTVLKNKNIEGVELDTLLRAINDRILLLLDKDHLIGHAYLIGIQNLAGLIQAFKNKIIPLLEEYFYHDRAKIGLVLGEKFVKREESKNIKFAKGFNDVDIEYLEEKKVYSIADLTAENFTAEDFKSIYATAKPKSEEPSEEAKESNNA